MICHFRVKGGGSNVQGGKSNVQKGEHPGHRDTSLIRKCLLPAVGLCLGTYGGPRGEQFLTSNIPLQGGVRNIEGSKNTVTRKVRVPDFVQDGAGGARHKQDSRGQVRALT